MRYLLIATLLASFTLLGKPKSFEEMKEKRIEKLNKIQEKKYEHIKSKLTESEQKKVLPILKKYDKLTMKLRLEQIKKNSRFAKKWNSNSKQFIKRAKARLRIKKGILNLRIKEIEELESSGVSNKVIEELIKFEESFQNRFHKRMRKNRRMHRNRRKRGNRGHGWRGNQGNRGMNQGK